MKASLRKIVLVNISELIKEIEASEQKYDIALQVLRGWYKLFTKLPRKQFSESLVNMENDIPINFRLRVRLIILIVTGDLSDGWKLNTATGLIEAA